MEQFSRAEPTLEGLTLRRLVAEWSLHGWLISLVVLTISIPIWILMSALSGVLDWWILGGPVLTTAVLNTAAAAITVARRGVDPATAAGDAATWWGVFVIVSIFGQALVR